MVEYMANTYNKLWASAHPGCLIFLLDQSGSMAEQFGPKQAGRGRLKCDMVATILNSLLDEMIKTNIIPRSDGSVDVRPRADIAILGYEGNWIGSALAGPLADRNFVSLPELQRNPVDIVMYRRKDIDDTGAVIEVEIPFPIWVRPKAGGGTPMCAALRWARDLAEQWTITHLDSYPPLVINVTDGAPTDGDPLELARELNQIRTNDGNTLLFNVHLSEHDIAPVMFPASKSDLPNDKYARMLFDLSSVIPDTSRYLLQSLLGRFVPPSSRGLIFNGDAISLRYMFNFATLPATVALDPNR
jgi:hypothetical protein